MAVVVNPRYSIQAVAGKHAVIEGRAVIISSDAGVDDLPSVEYPDHVSPTKVWVALCPPENFIKPISHELYTATYKAIYNLEDENIYSNPIFTEEFWLEKHSIMKAPVVHRYERLALFRGVVGITEECHQGNDQIKVPGASLAIDPNGLFRKVDKNHPIIVGETVRYSPQAGLLYINVF